MEDELDRRGVPRPMPSDSHAHMACGVDSKHVSRTITTRMEGGAITVTTPISKGVAGDGEGEDGAGTGSEGPLLSPRGRGYLARLVLEVCSEIEESKKVLRD